MAIFEGSKYFANYNRDHANQLLVGTAYKFAGCVNLKELRFYSTNLGLINFPIFTNELLEVLDLRYTSIKGGAPDTADGSQESVITADTFKNATAFSHSFLDVTTFSHVPWVLISYGLSGSAQIHDRVDEHILPTTDCRKNKNVLPLPQISLTI